MRLTRKVGRAPWALGQGKGVGRGLHTDTYAPAVLRLGRSVDNSLKFRTVDQNRSRPRMCQIGGGSPPFRRSAGFEGKDVRGWGTGAGLRGRVQQQTFHLCVCCVCGRPSLCAFLSGFLLFVHLLREEDISFLCLQHYIAGRQLRGRHPPGESGRGGGYLFGSPEGEGRVWDTWERLVASCMLG